MDGLVNDLGTLGRAGTDYTLVFSVILGIIFLIGGIILLTSKKSSDETDDAYNKRSKGYKLGGFMLIVIAILLPTFAFGNYYFTHKSKTYAEVTGALDIANIFKGFFKFK